MPPDMWARPPRRHAVKIIPIPDERARPMISSAAWQCMLRLWMATTVLGGALVLWLRAVR